MFAHPTITALQLSGAGGSSMPYLDPCRNAALPPLIWQMSGRWRQAIASHMPLSGKTKICLPLANTMVVPLTLLTGTFRQIEGVPRYPPISSCKQGQPLPDQNKRSDRSGRPVATPLREERRLWSVHSAVRLCSAGGEARFWGKVPLLHQDSATSVLGAVEQLNQPLMSWPENFCIVFVKAEHCYYLIYKMGHKSEAFAALALSPPRGTGRLSQAWRAATDDKTLDRIADADEQKESEENPESERGSHDSTCSRDAEEAVVNELLECVACPGVHQLSVDEDLQSQPESQAEQTVAEALCRFDPRNSQMTPWDSDWAGGTESSDIRISEEFNIDARLINHAKEVATEVFPRERAVSPFSQYRMRLGLAIEIEDAVEPKTADKAHREYRPHLRENDRNRSKADLPNARAAKEVMDLIDAAILPWAAAQMRWDS